MPKMHFEYKYKGQMYGLHIEPPEGNNISMTITDLEDPDALVPAGAVYIAQDIVRTMFTIVSEGRDPGEMRMVSLSQTDEHVARDGPTIPEWAEETLQKMDEEE